MTVHPHVALHLSLELFLGSQFVRRDAVSGGMQRDHGGQLPNQMHRLRANRHSRQELVRQLGRSNAEEAECINSSMLLLFPDLILEQKDTHEGK